MATLREQKKAQLVKNRNQLMDMVFDAKMKRANEQRVIKDFASVVTFLDHEDDLPLLVKPIAKKQAANQTKAQKASIVPPIVKRAVETRTQQPLVETPAGAEAQGADVEVISSDYWDKKFT